MPWSFDHPLPLAVLISGRGSNLQSIIDAIADNLLPARIRVVISSSADAGGVERAARAGIPTRIVQPRDHPDRDAYDRALMQEIDRFEPGLVVLAGFMRILGPAFVRHYAGRLINIHPSLLPRYPGLNTHERALRNGDREHGATVHFVTDQLDSGPAIIQARVPVQPGDTPDALAARVLEKEHRIYPLAIRWFAQGRISVRGAQALLDGEHRPEQGLEPADASRG